MKYLIDGYNLIYAAGLMPVSAGPRGLEPSRRRLLGLLWGAFGKEVDRVTVVFDAQAAPPDMPAAETFHGIHVLFAVDHEQADDLIETLIQKEATPKKLTVVSDDHRLQLAAQRRNCISAGCEKFLDFLDKRRKSRKPHELQPPEKRSGLSPEETERWLQEFHDVDQSPDAKELRDPFGFLEKDEP